MFGHLAEPAPPVRALAARSAAAREKAPKRIRLQLANEG